MVFYRIADIFLLPKRHHVCKKRTQNCSLESPFFGLQDWHAKVRQAALEALSEASGLGLRSFQWVKDKICSLPNSSKLAQWRLKIPKKGGWPSQISGHVDWPVCTFTLFLWCWHNLRSGYSPSGSKCAGLMQFTCRSLYIYVHIASSNILILNQDSKVDEIGRTLLCPRVFHHFHSSSSFCPTHHTAIEPSKPWRHGALWCHAAAAAPGKDAIQTFIYRGVSSAMVVYQRVTYRWFTMIYLFRRKNNTIFAHCYGKSTF